MRWFQTRQRREALSRVMFHLTFTVDWQSERDFECAQNLVLELME